MIKKVTFTKMHGLGNDYIYLDCTKEELEFPAENSIAWSRYHLGIGSDGLILIEKSDIADIKMRMFNADGSEGEMCGNASRCIGKLCYEAGICKKEQIKMETLAGIIILNLHFAKDKEGNKFVPSVEVDMGQPSTENIAFKDGKAIEMLDDEIVIDGQIYRGTTVSMGNPHLIIFVDDINKIELEKIGPKFENHPYFPERINTEFAQILENGQIRMRVWERGSGITQACGTGACATAVAAALTGRSKRQSEIIMDGGTLKINWDKKTQHVMMDGPAIIAFTGEIETVK